MSLEFGGIATFIVTVKNMVFGRCNVMQTCFTCVVMIWCSLMHAEDAASQDKTAKSAPQASQRDNRDKKDDPDGVAITAEIIGARTGEIDRLLKRLHRIGPIEFPPDILNSAPVRALAKLQAIEAVPILCEKIAFHGSGDRSPNALALPAAEALILMGGSSLPGIYNSLEEKAKTDKEIKVFAFVLRAIDKREELTVFRLELEVRHRTEDTERNTTFKGNARKLLKCFATPDFFRLENNPFYGN